MAMDLRTAFERHDKDRSGAIDVAELEGLLRALGVRAGDDAGLEAIAQLRTASPGRVTYEELAAWWSQHGSALRSGGARDPGAAAVDDEISLSIGSDPREVFDSFDRDGSGSIERRELARILTALGMEVDGERVKRAMKALDTDGDGRISLDEFSAWWSVLGR